MNKSIFAVVVAAAALGLSACGPAVEAAQVVPSASVEVATPETVPDTTSDEPDVVAEEEVEVSIPTSFKVGQTAKIGDWEVRVTKVTKPTTKQVRAWNSFNDKAEGQYVLASYTAKYVGSERTKDAMFALSWKFGGTDGQVYDTASVVTPADKKDTPTEARPGGTIKGEAIFDVPKAAIKGGVVTVEGYDDSFEKTYADYKF